MFSKLRCVGSRVWKRHPSSEGAAKSRVAKEIRGSGKFRTPTFFVKGTREGIPSIRRWRFGTGTEAGTSTVLVQVPKRRRSLEKAKTTVPSEKTNVRRATCKHRGSRQDRFAGTRPQDRSLTGIGHSAGHEHSAPRQASCLRGGCEFDLVQNTLSKLPALDDPSILGGDTPADGRLYKSQNQRQMRCQRASRRKTDATKSDVGSGFAARHMPEHNSVSGQKFWPKQGMSPEGKTNSSAQSIPLVSRTSRSLRAKDFHHSLEKELTRNHSHQIATPTGLPEEDRTGFEAKKSATGISPQRQTTEKHSAEESVRIISSPTGLSIEVFSIFTDFSRFPLRAGFPPPGNATVGMRLRARCSQCKGKTIGYEKLKNGNCKLQFGRGCRDT